MGGEDGGRKKSHRDWAPRKAGRDPVTEQGHRDTGKAGLGLADREQR